MLTRLSTAKHLGIYAAFHQDPANRFIHRFGVPLVMFSGAIFLAYLPLQPGSVLNAGSLIAALFLLLFAPLDWLGGALTATSLLIQSLIAGWLTRVVPTTLLLPLAAGLSGLGWYALVVIGHRLSEPYVRTARGGVDSNEYFRRGLFVGSGAGVTPTPVDRVIQFCIGPFAEAMDLLHRAGFRAALFAAVGRERAELLRLLSTTAS